MTQQEVQQTPLVSQQVTWSWPLHPTAYDHTPTLSEAEYAILKQVFSQPSRPIKKPIKATLHRLIAPLHDVLVLRHSSKEVYDGTLRFMLYEMYRSGKTFWAWSKEEWTVIVGLDKRTFVQQQRGKYTKIRSILLQLTYLLEILPDTVALIPPTGLSSFARKVFGDTVIDEAVSQITTVLSSWGYRYKDPRHYVTCLCYLALQNRSPYLEDLSSELLESVYLTCNRHAVHTGLFRISRALFTLGMITSPLPSRQGKTTHTVSGTDGSVNQEWLRWCQRWREHSTLQNRDVIYYPLLKIGRWLHTWHPEVTSPAHWTYELAAELVAAVNEMKIGDWGDTAHRRSLGDQIGQPLRPATKSRLLNALRTFLHDCQEWEWISIQFNAHRALRTPKAIRNLIGPDPRMVDKPLWAKLLWAAMNLEEKDLPLAGGINAPLYPLEMVRAIAVVWCFAALRSNEILRLRIGCIRWQYEDVMIPETGEMLPRDAICFLDVPVNKTSTAYTKPVHTLVGKRIDEWVRVRPDEQPKALDKKTSESVQFLFFYRGKHISPSYVTEQLVPLLCRKAGIPLEDSRGKITSHRARATIASMLYNAKDPLDLFQLKEYLGHKHLSSTQYYAKVDPTKLASQVAKAGYLEQNLATIEVLLDQDAVVSGAAAQGSDWKLYDLGHGFCANPFWSQCSHRMACARCPFYRPKNSTMDHLIEGKVNLVRMLEFVSLTEDEKLLVTEGIELHQALLEKLVDEPTSAGPTPRQLEEQRQQTETIIPLPTVQRVKQKE